MDGGAGKGHIRIGIDTGGTFTDIVAIDAAAGTMNVTKVSSTPHNPAVGLVQGIHDVLEKTGDDPADVGVICHGTTVATNALLQGQIEGLGLIVTRGFRHILEIARQAVPDGYGNSYFWVKPDRLVPLHFVQEVGGRMNFKGEELDSLDEESVRAAARALKQQEVGAIGVCLMHSYANNAHEKRVAEIIAEEYPDAVVSLSCDVLPEYREYERAVTTLVDAFVKPYMSRYLGNVSEELGPTLREPPFLVMQSSGGVISAEQVVDKPITTALSGPAAGALGAAVVSKLAGFDNVVTLDAGGTSNGHLPDRGRGPAHHDRRFRRPLSRPPADDRYPHGRHRRRLDRLEDPRRQPERRPDQRRRRARAHVLPRRRRRAGPSPTPTWRWAACLPS